MKHLETHAFLETHLHGGRGRQPKANEAHVGL